MSLTYYLVCGRLYISYFDCLDRYFQAAYPSAIERRIFSVSIPTTINPTEFKVEPKALTDSSDPSFYTTKFSPEAGFYLLSYAGPNIPWQRVVQADNPSEY